MDEDIRKSINNEGKCYRNTWTNAQKYHICGAENIKMKISSQDSMTTWKNINSAKL